MSGRRINFQGEWISFRTGLTQPKLRKDKQKKRKSNRKRKEKRLYCNRNNIVSNNILQHMKQRNLHHSCSEESKLIVIHVTAMNLLKGWKREKPKKWVLKNISHARWFRKKELHGKKQLGFAALDLHFANRDWTLH